MWCVLCAMGKALIMIDMTVEQWANVSFRRDATLAAIKRLVGMNGFFDLKVDSHLWIHDAKESFLWSVHPDVGHAGAPGAEVIPELRQCSGAEELVFVEKKNYSSFPGNDLEALLRKKEIDEVYLCGINTDYCVFATALDAFQKQFNVFIVKDAVTSITGKSGHEEGIFRAVNHFSEKCLVESKRLSKSDEKILAGR